MMNMPPSMRVRLSSIQPIFPSKLHQPFSHEIFRICYARSPISVRCVSQSAKSDKLVHDPKRSGEQQKVASLQRKGRADASRKAAILLNRLSKGNTSRLNVEKTSSIKNAPSHAASNDPSEQAPNAIIQGREKATAPPKDPHSQKSYTTFQISPIEEAVQRRILENQRKILWPGIWTALALAGTFGTLAYLDAKHSGNRTGDPIQSSQRAKIPQTWYLTSTVIKEGIQAGWNELDKLTIGILVTSIGIHLMKRSPLPFWEKLIHITGEKKYTAFTHPYTHASWKHLGNNMIAMCWFLPGVVHYLDGDVFHAAAFFISVPLITSYLNHFSSLLSPASSIAISLGSSGSVSAIFGAFCMAYPNEKVWLPELFILRLDAKYWGALYVLRELIGLAKASTPSERSSLVVHALSFGLGVAYIYFNGKENLWKPLRAQFVERDPVSDT